MRSTPTSSRSGAAAHRGAGVCAILSSRSRSWRSGGSCAPSPAALAVVLEKEVQTDRVSGRIGRRKPGLAPGPIAEFDQRGFRSLRVMDEVRQPRLHVDVPRQLAGHHPRIDKTHRPFAELALLDLAAQEQTASRMAAISIDRLVEQLDVVLRAFEHLEEAALEEN